MGGIYDYCICAGVADAQASGSEESIMLSGNSAGAYSPATVDVVERV